MQIKDVNQKVVKNMAKDRKLLKMRCRFRVKKGNAK